MFSFAEYIDLPLVWGVLIATAVLLYVLLDGFDLGLGIIFPFAPSDKCRNRMMNSIAPFWDGNETWLVLGGGGLFAAFPLAYAIVMPALYIPVSRRIHQRVSGIWFSISVRWARRLCRGLFWAASCRALR
jgi:cytochrome d ubiquinol oxidase subunit II